MNRQHTGLDLAGIVIIYVMSCIYILLVIVSWISWGYLDFYEVIILLLGLSSLFVTFLYHTNKTKNFILVGVLGIFVSLIGGIFILVGQTNTVINKQNSRVSINLNSLEYQINKLDSLLAKGVITYEKYITKRRSIIEHF